MTLTPKNWKEFQHYKDRAPSWIKLHRGLLNDFKFHRLPIASKALAPMLWLLASEYDDGAIPLSLEEIGFRLHLSDEDLRDALKPLISAGFFSDDSGLLADGYQPDSLEKREENKEREEKEENYRAVARATRRETSAQIDPDFDRFWEAYPQRDGANPKAPAAKKFAALVRTGVPAETMIQGALQAADAARKRGDFGSRFIPTAIVWLNQQRWADAAAELFQATNRSPDERSHHNRAAGAAARSQANGDATLAGLGKIAGRIRERGMAERQADCAAAGGDDLGRADAAGGPATRGELLALPRPNSPELSGCGGGDVGDRGEADAGAAGPEGDGGQRGSERRSLHGGAG